MPSIKKNYLYNLIYQFVSIVMPIITAPYISKIFGPYNVGINSYTNSILSYFILFAALGTAFYGKREVARYRDDKKKLSETFWEVFLLGVLSTSVCSIVWIFLIYLQKDLMIYFCILSLQLIAVPLDITWFFGGIEEFDKILARNLFVRLISVFLIFLLVKNSSDLWKYVLIISLTVLLGNISMWFFLKNYLVPVKIDFRRMRYHFGQTLIYFLPTIATTIYTLLDRTMIQMITEDLNENGYYEQAVKICSIPMSCILAMDAVVGSRMSYLIEKKKNEEVKYRLENSLSFVSFLGIPMVFGIDIIVRQLVPWFLGPDFYKTISLVWLYSPLILCVAINNFLSEQYLTPLGKRKQTAKIVIISACINFFLNLLMIPKYYASGAAFTSVVSEAFIAIAYIFMCKDILPLRKYFSHSWKNLVASGIMAITIYLITSKWDSNILTTLVQIMIGLTSYITILLLLKDNFTKKLIAIIRR